MPVSERIVHTSHGEVAVSETSGAKLPVLLIHGNSSCKEAFRHQYDGPLGEEYRMIAMDLPGHGASSDAVDPAATYSMPGYAEVATEVLKSLGIEKAVVLGWSLGGHIGIELLSRFPGLVGLMITGAPPVRRDAESIQKGFNPTPALFLAGKKDFTPEDFAAFADLTCGSLADATLRHAMHRTDGRARSLMFESLLAGKASDQRELAEKSSVPIAIVNGAEDPIVNLEYIGGLSYKNLWDEHCFVLRGLGHVPFLQAPEAFNAIFGRFLVDMERRAAKHDGRRARRSTTVAA
jgi:pimeloyl-ACP methyl ester carboxylesterase